MKDHIEANHLEGISLPCNYCDKIFRSRHITYHLFADQNDLEWHISHLCCLEPGVLWEPIEPGITLALVISSSSNKYLSFFCCHFLKKINFYLDGSSFQNIWHIWWGFGILSHLLAFLVSFGLRLLPRYSGFYSDICVQYQRLRSLFRIMVSQGMTKNLTDHKMHLGMSSKNFFQSGWPYGLAPPPLTVIFQPFP